MQKLISLIFMVLTISVQSQFQKGFYFDGKVESINLNDLKPTMVYGGELKCFISENFSLDYSISVGKNYFHVPLSIPTSISIYHFQKLVNDLRDGAYEAELDSSESSFELLYLLALLIPDGVTGHFKLGSKTYLSPSIKPFSYDLIGEDSPNKDLKPLWYLANESGLEIEHFVKKNYYVTIFGKFRNTFLKIRKFGQPNQFRFGYSFGFKVGGYLKWVEGK